MPYGAGHAFDSAYVYGYNNPLQYVDPTGLRACNSGRGKTGTCSQQVNYVWGEVRSDVPIDVLSEILRPPTQPVSMPQCMLGKKICDLLNPQYPPGVEVGIVLVVPGKGTIGSGVDLTEAGVPKVIYRQGTPSPSNLTPRGVDAGDLSFRDSLSNRRGTGQPPVLNPGKDFIGIDTSKLPPGSVIYDNVPPGHVTVRGVTPEQLKAAVVERGKFPK